MRESGILMPVSSLPGPYGIGCFGKEAFKFVDFLAQAGQKIWQILPLSPTGYGDSPYQSCSAFAGNPYFIDLDALKEEGLLTAAQLKAEKWGTDPKEVDYGTLYVSRFKVLRTAYAAWRKQCAGLHGCSYYFPDDYYAFTLANEEWLDDYALYMALKVANGMKNWVEWDKPYRLRDRKALAAFAALGCNERFPVFLQIFHHQSGFLVDHNRTDRHFYDQVFAILAITFFLHAILTVFGFVFSFITKIHQCAHIFICLKDDISAFAAVSAIRSAFWNKRFSSK